MKASPDNLSITMNSVKLKMTPLTPALPTSLRMLSLLSLSTLFILFTLLSLLSPIASSADLLSIYRSARDNDPTFDAARYSREAVQQQVPQARANLLPSVGLSGSQGRNNSTAKFTGVPETQRPIDSWNWTLQLTQPLIRMQNVHAYTQSTAQAEAAEAQFAAIEQELILKVAQAYFDVLIAENAVSTTQAQRRSMQEQLASAEKGYESGLHAITDVHEARSKAEEARAQQVTAENELENKKSELEKITGILPQHLASLNETLLIPNPQPANVNEWIDQARVQNPMVRMQEYLVTAAEAGVSKSKAEHLPTLDLVASHGRSYSSGSYSTPSDYYSRYQNNQIGFQLNIPIFAGGGTNARVAEARANKGKTQAQLEESKRNAVAEARQSYAAIMSGLSRIDALNAAIKSGQSSVKGNQVGYKMGLRINSDVLMAEQQLYVAKHEQVKARYEVLLHGLRLKAAVGILSEESVQEINLMLRQ